MNGMAGLELNNRGADAPIVFEAYNDKVPHHSSATPSSPWQQLPTLGESQESAIKPSGHPQGKRKGLCGLTPTTLCLSIALVAVIILSAAGIGVAAAFAVKNGKDKADSRYTTVG